ncbi:MAG: hypothetical protein KC547_18185 [Anaerolineae bacterium]|nr:hypothetical protein [Anaerolineae bacterium]
MTTVKPMPSVERYEEELNIGQRVGEMFAVAGLLLLASFFILHQTRATGFFTDKFGTPEMFLFYAPLLFSLLDALVQVVTGDRHLARPFQALSGLLMGLAALWFLINFPFEFAHLPDVLPEGLRFLLAWITNDLAKIPLVIQLIVGPITALVALWRFFFSRR